MVPMGQLNPNKFNPMWVTNCRAKKKHWLVMSQILWQLIRVKESAGDRLR